MKRWVDQIGVLGSLALMASCGKSEWKVADVGPSVMENRVGYYAQIAPDVDQVRSTQNVQVALTSGPWIAQTPEGDEVQLWVSPYGKHYLAQIEYPTIKFEGEFNLDHQTSEFHGRIQHAYDPRWEDRQGPRSFPPQYWEGPRDRWFGVLTDWSGSQFNGRMIRTEAGPRVEFYLYPYEKAGHLGIDGAYGMTALCFAPVKYTGGRYNPCDFETASR